MTLAVNYVGDESHFIVNSGTTGTATHAGTGANELDPKYLAALGGAGQHGHRTAADSRGHGGQRRHSASRRFPARRAGVLYQAAAAINSAATIAQMLAAFPQYSGVSDTWGNVGNFNYNSLQITLDQRMSNGLTFNVNYTFAKNVGDDGTFRSGFDIPAAAISHGTRAGSRDRIDRSLTATRFPRRFMPSACTSCRSGRGKSATIRRWCAGWRVDGSSWEFITLRQGRPWQWSGPDAVRRHIQGRASVCRT